MWKTCEKIFYDILNIWFFGNNLYVSDYIHISKILIK